MLYKAIAIRLKFRTIFDQADNRANRQEILWFKPQNISVNE
ncbi:hypothetical protein A6A12_0251 [Vibrio anguillarum]|nr:hypothetical protein A6A12_0251 [Vibrio anguillarum]